MKTLSAPTPSLGARCALRAVSLTLSVSWYVRYADPKSLGNRSSVPQEVETLTQADELLKKLGLKKSILEPGLEPTSDE